MEIRSAGQLALLVQEYGLLPFFKNEIPGFSVEEHTPRELWFSDDADGPWEWKGPVARRGDCVYGKFFMNKAAFVSLALFPTLANLRRLGYDFDARFDDGLAQYKDKDVFEAISQNGLQRTREIKKHCGYKKGGLSGFDAVITRLQMQTYICAADFEYATDRNGKQYGWGVARWSTPEAAYGEAVRAAYNESPEVSRDRLLRFFSDKLPEATKEQLLRVVG